MNRALRLAGLLLTVAVVAAAACFLTGRFLSHHPAPGTGQGADAAHQWVHRELKLTAEQDQALHAIEQRYAARRDELKTAIRQANAELARAIRKDRADSPKVSAAVDKIHQAQGYPVVEGEFPWTSPGSPDSFRPSSERRRLRFAREPVRSSPSPSTSRAES